MRHARRAPLLALVLALLCRVGAPETLGAWGMDVHRLITRRAIDGLPSAIRPFFIAQREFIVEHSVDPDLWRIADLRGALGREDPNHFLDIDGLDEPAPFRGVPRAREAFLARYGGDRAERMGRLPWRVDEIYRRLVDTFKQVGRPETPYAADNVRYLTAVIAHYLEDNNQPFHAILNYDGQLTGQRGVHARFETHLVLRHQSKVRWAPVEIKPVGPIVDYVFDTLVASHALSATVLDADRKAATLDPAYGDRYYAAMWRDLRPLVERRLSDSVSAVASVVVAAWAEAGRPTLLASERR